MSDNTTLTPAELACPRMINLGTYLLGGLSTDEAQSTRRHIDTCTYCQKELAALRPVTDLLSTAELDPTLSGERVEPDPSLATRLLARAEQEIDDTTSVMAAIEPVAVVNTSTYDVVTPHDSVRANATSPSRHLRWVPHRR
jgi:anti-sigma factor RsiW